MADYNTLYEFDNTWTATRVILDRELGADEVSFCVTFDNGNIRKSLEFIGADDPENIIALIDFDQVSISEELDSDRDFFTIKIEIVADAYCELWCHSVTLKS